MATSVTPTMAAAIALPRKNILCSSSSTSTYLRKYPSSSSSSSSASSKRSVLASAKQVVGLGTSVAMKSKAADAASELRGTSIFLVGLNSTMKTKLGNALADALRYYYFDTDSLVEQAAGGESAARSLRESDQQGYNDSETEVLRQLSSMGRLVVCAGDGAVQSSTNLALLRHGISIWIDIPIRILASEAIGEPSEALANLSAQYERMKDGYSVADATVSLQKVACQLGYEDMEAVTVEDMAVEALKEIEKLTRVKKMLEAAARPF